MKIILSKSMNNFKRNFLILLTIFCFGAPAVSLALTPAELNRIQSLSPAQQQLAAQSLGISLSELKSHKGDVTFETSEDGAEEKLLSIGEREGEEEVEEEGEEE
ncbi:MAG: hypothetical protein PSN04_06400, partial [Methyloprofundus sp.]|nr:hypothetical protein [Methyloprofundus sp.]